MNRLQLQPSQEATGKTAELFSLVRRVLGTVPNVYNVIGSNSHIALRALLSLDAVIADCSLSTEDVGLIRLAASQASQCNYCVATHTFAGKRIGLSAEEMLGARFGGQGLNERQNVLTNFVRQITSSNGSIAEGAVREVQQAGYTDGQIIDALLVIAEVTFTSLVNKVHDTELDFPSV